VFLYAHTFIYTYIYIYIFIYTGNGGREESVFCGMNKRFSKPAPTLSGRERPGFDDDGDDNVYLII
jgi:hypothetical protein